MPDTRSHRGPHPKDEACFSPACLPTLRFALQDLCLLLSKGYSARPSLELVANRYALHSRQRTALQRCAASDGAVRQRLARRLEREDLRGKTLVVDGYNVLLTVESALGGGVLLVARDGTLRDLAAMSGHYRRVAETQPALELLAEVLHRLGCLDIRWYFDRPISNSARLKKRIEDIATNRPLSWVVELTDRTDRVLVDSGHIVASADSAILDGCHRWLNLARLVVDDAVPEAWIVDLVTEDDALAPWLGSPTGEL